jgi:hypothetical protein
LSSQVNNQQEIADWFSHPITEQFYKEIERAIGAIHEDKRNAYNPDSAHSTQERFAWLLGAEWALGEIIDMREREAIGEGNE